MSRLFDMAATPGDIQIQIRSDGKVIWINQNGICVVRICQIRGMILVEDERLANPGAATGNN